MRALVERDLRKAYLGRALAAYQARLVWLDLLLKA
jgi:hypothetical protein